MFPLTCAQATEDNGATRTRAFSHDPTGRIQREFENSLSLAHLTHQDATKGGSSRAPALRASVPPRTPLRTTLTTDCAATPMT